MMGDKRPDLEVVGLGSRHRRRYREPSGICVRLAAPTDVGTHSLLLVLSFFAALHDLNVGGHVALGLDDDAFALVDVGERGGA